MEKSSTKAETAARQKKIGEITAEKRSAEEIVAENQKANDKATVESEEGCYSPNKCWKSCCAKKKGKTATDIQTKAVATKAKEAAKTKNEEDELTEFHSDGGKQLKKADTQLRTPR